MERQVSKLWTQSQAIELCIAIESIAPRFGYHVALTGGCLYKSASLVEGIRRKDLDLIFYCVRSYDAGHRRESGAGGWVRQRGDREGLLLELWDSLGLRIVDNWGPWKKIAMLGSKYIDMLFPDEEK